MTATLSVLCATRDPGPRVRALLEPLRPVADEIVIAVDDRAGDAELGHYAAVADRLMRYDRGPTHSSLAWLAAQCRGDWILVLAGDEVASPALVAALPDLIASRRAAQYLFPLRWLWPGPGTSLDGEPWHPDFHCRLMRNDAGLRFLGIKHELARDAHPRRFSELPLWHLSLLLSDVQARRDKVRRNQAERPGLVAPGGGELNAVYYLPEEAAAPALGAVPPEDLAAIRRVLDPAPAAPAAVPAEVPHGGRTEIEALWAQRSPGEDAFAAGVAPLAARPLAVRPGERRIVYVRVRNEGGERWPWGLDHPPLFRVGFRWHPADPAAPAEPEGRAAFPHDVWPGEEAVVPVAFVAPDTPGRWALEVGVLLEDVRWFGAPCRIDVTVGS
jgi:hypothetical protein